MENFTVRMDEEMLQDIEEEVESDPRYEHRSEVVRYCVRVAIGSEYGQSE